jgi:hypothetical protein
LIYGVLGSVLWEVVEHFLERRFPKAWSHRLEHPVNKWVVDPLSNLVGLIVGVLGVVYYRMQ